MQAFIFLNLLIRIPKRSRLLHVAVPRLRPLSHQRLTAEAQVRFKVSPCGLFGGQTGSGTGFSPRT